MSWPEAGGYARAGVDYSVHCVLAEAMTEEDAEGL
jgi:hypothetical protein